MEYRVQDNVISWIRSLQRVNFSDCANAQGTLSTNNMSSTN